MHKRTIVLLLVLLNLWQAAFAAAVPQVLAAHEGELVHAALHWQGEAHHHDADGSVHVDDSHDSIQHVMADCSAHHLGLIVATPTTDVEAASQAMPHAAAAMPPSPFLDGLRRPPRVFLS